MSEPMDEEDTRTVRSTMKELQAFFMEKNIHPNVAFSAMVSLMLSHSLSQKDPLGTIKEIAADMISAMEGHLNAPSQ